MDLKTCSTCYVKNMNENHHKAVHAPRQTKIFFFKIANAQH